jgi:hypothetical protein
MRVADPANPWMETRRWGPHGTLHSHFYDSKALEYASAQVAESWSHVGGDAKPMIRGARP